MKTLKIVVTTLICIYSLVLQIPSINGDLFGGLYPRESKFREVKSLDGLWDFRLAPTNDSFVGFREEWYKQPLKLSGSVISMPVPSSYNDVTQSAELRDHVGWAWYDREFYIPSRWIEDGLLINIRFGSAHYNSILYVNGEEILSHEFGHLPFSADITNYVTADSSNLITLCINNTLTNLTIPQGSFTFQNDMNMYPEGYFTMEYGFDFFNYAGIHRTVHIYTTPVTYIEDITISTDIVGSAGVIDYSITVTSPSVITNSDCGVEIYDEENNMVASASSCSGEITLENANFWWPYMMAEDPGYMYTMRAFVAGSEGEVDVYPQKFGIRTIGWTSTSVTINGVPLYLRGCGKHEDFNIIGKGMNYANIVKDFSLLKWLGANSFRTSHYPYAEEIMDMADEEGIMVIDECPAVVLEYYGDVLLEKHQTAMAALYRRDKNRPSVIMWSVANEPISEDPAADPHFQEVVAFVKTLDTSRPVTFATNREYDEDQAAKHMDVILVNRYYSWYADHGHLELIQKQTEYDFNMWYETYQRPIAISEYGAGALTGAHLDPASSWSEEFQVRLMAENFKAFDTLRGEGFFFGEMIWNFADFATRQDVQRPIGNRKGVFTRDRQPKFSAHYLRERYHALASTTSSDSDIWNMFAKQQCNGV